MNEYGPTYNEIDGYLEDLTDAEREELAKADAAIELALLLYDAREARGLTQEEAAELAGLRQQAVSRLEQPETKLVNTKLDTLRKYLTSLDYILQLAIKDAQSGAVVSKISLSPFKDKSVEGLRPAAWDVQSAIGGLGYEAVRGSTLASAMDASRAWANSESIFGDRLFATTPIDLGKWYGGGTFSYLEGQTLDAITGSLMLGTSVEARTKTPAKGSPQKDFGTKTSAAA